jgi:hypothetical protein
MSNHWYYLGRTYDENRYIGYSREGAPFLLNVTDETRCPKDWQVKWEEGGRITNAYGLEFHYSVILDIIEKRGWIGIRYKQEKTS